jgi:ABC-2 type transport system ATP-binding protein
MKGGDTWELLLKGPPAQEALRRLGRLGLETASVSASDCGGGTVKMSFFLKESDQGERIFDWAVSEGLKILSMNRKLLSLEDIFVKLTSDEGRSQQLTSGEGSAQAAREGNHEA